MGDFKPQELANTAWACATVGQTHGPLFATVATEAEQGIGDFRPRHVFKLLVAPFCTRACALALVRA